MEGAPVGGGGGRGEPGEGALPLLTGEPETPSLTVEILRIAWPVSINWLIMNVGQVVVLYLLSIRGDELGMAGIGLASVLCNVTGRTLLWGLGSALDTYASQAWGAGEYQSIGVFGQRTLVLLTCTVNVPLALLWINAEAILRSLGQAPPPPHRPAPPRPTAATRRVVLRRRAAVASPCRAPLALSPSA
eukprot:2045967-Prymnesium_polylepis.1